jgi:hypothetical protein
VGQVKGRESAIGTPGRVRESLSTGETARRETVDEVEIVGKVGKAGRGDGGE